MCAYPLTQHKKEKKEKKEKKKKKHKEKDKERKHEDGGKHKHRKDKLHTPVSQMEEQSVARWLVRQPQRIWVATSVNF